MNVNVTKICLQSDAKDLFRCKSKEHFFSFFHLDVESLVTYPNTKKIDFLNDDLLLPCMVHIMPKNCNL